MVCKLDPGKATKNEGFTGGATLSPANINDVNQALVVPSSKGDYYTNN